MIGVSIIIFLIIPESPWWLVSKDKQAEATKILQRFYGRVEGYDVRERIVRLSPNMCHWWLPDTNLSIECNDGHGRWGATYCEGKCTGGYVGYFPWSKRCPIHYCGMAKNHTTVRWTVRVQYLCYLLLCVTTVFPDSTAGISNTGYFSPICRQQESIPGDSYPLLLSNHRNDLHFDTHRSFWPSPPYCVALCCHGVICSMPWHYRMLWLHSKGNQFSTGPFCICIRYIDTWLTTDSDLLCMLGNLHHYWCLRHWICLRRRGSPTVSESPDRRLVSGFFEFPFNHVQLLHTLDD